MINETRNRLSSVMKNRAAVLIGMLSTLAFMIVPAYAQSKQETPELTEETASTSESALREPTTEANAEASASRWRQRCSSIGTGANDPCVEWTGSWPTGMVRAFAGPINWGVRLMVCSGCGGPTGWHWRVAAEGRNRPVRVPANGQKVGKHSWYKTCFKQHEWQTTGWTCMYNGDAVYLGD